MIDATGLMVFYENMLGLNNVSIKCNENQIVGVFGANSAGKSTLMYTLSGIIEDIRKKEVMAGGERISVLGNIKYLGEEIMGLKPSQRAKKGLVLCPERRRIFKECTVLENLRIGGYLATSSQAKKNPGLCIQDFSGPGKASKKNRWIFKRWRAADAGHWACADGTAQIAAAGRTFAGLEPPDAGRFGDGRPKKSVMNRKSPLL